MLPASAVSGDKYRFCPYDKTHVILAKSFDAHLTKCRENHRGHKMVECPFDHTHVIPKPELHHHLTQCDKRCLMDRDLQKRAGDSVLKGDVHGPPIVADHLAGADAEENWDEAPVRSVRTPALFNEKIRNTPRDSYGIIPGGGYAPPPAEEPKIRKIPNNPAKAATLSNPAAAQIRPVHNQVYEFSLEKARMSNVNQARPPSWAPPLQAVAPGAPGGGYTRVRGPAPTATTNQGPRFIGRGVSKYATKTKPVSPGLLATPAAATPITNASPGSPPSASSNDDNNIPTTQPPQFEDIVGVSSSPNQRKQRQSPSKKNRNKAADDSNLQQQQQQQQQLQQQLQQQQQQQQQQLGTLEDNNAAAAGTLASLQNQQRTLEQEILLHQEKQLEQLKLEHGHQKEELARKHQLQIMQLQKLQEDEAAALTRGHERQEQDLCNKVRVLNQSLQAMTAAATSSLSPPSLSPGSSSASSSHVDLVSPQNTVNAMVAPGAALGVVMPSASSPLGGTDTAGMSGGISRLTLQVTKDSSGDTDSATTSNLSAAELQKKRTTLENALREIEILEQKSMLGHVLSTAEEAKLESKDSLETQLAVLLQSSR